MRRLAAVLLVFLVTGCDSVGTLSPVGEVGPSVTAAQLAQAQRAWEASGIDDYEFEFRLDCFCAPGDRVRVRDGRVVETTRGEDARTETIDTLFETARRELANADTLEMYAADVRLSAQEPRIPVVIEYGTTDPGIADGFVRLVVTGFDAR